MVLIEAQGVEIEFPYEPYECQRVYMNHVVQALRAGQNALLESPTGTGKTLCLLCAVLAWRETFVANLQRGHSAADLGESQRMRSAAGAADSGVSGTALGALAGALAGDGKAGERAAPRIIYASRTHSQLSQVVRELRRTRYRPKVAVLGSRAQLCINDKVSKSSALNATCAKLVSKRACGFKNELDARKERLVESVFESPRDIEDIARLGASHKACPFYLSREAHESADIVFLPYSYIVDPQSRQALGTDWSNDVLIFDEAHNIDSVCMEAQSFDLSPQVRDYCLNELERCERLAGTSSSSPEADGPGFSQLRSALASLDKRLGGLRVADGYFSDGGDRILALLEEAGISRANQKVVRAQLEAGQDKLQSESSYGIATPGLSALITAMAICFDTSESVLRQHYRTCVTVVEESPPSGTLHRHLTGAKPSGRRRLSLWCMNPGTAMAAIAAKGIRSMILTSGTLSPLSATEEELGVPFPVKLENRHVIGADQAFMTCVPRGPRGTALNSSYKTRDSEDYLIDLGNALHNFAQVVPEGILVFFPSYQLLGKTLAVWRRRNHAESDALYDRLARKKPIVLEPRDANSFHLALQEHESNIESHRGSMFLAVCRGKSSEGLDFSDRLARAVVLVGIPYPMLKDPKVSLKRAYLDRKRAGSGQMWYTQTAFRAVNQAIGRVIRHRHDFGAILLCDERFLGENLQARLSAWLRPYYRSVDSFGSGQKSVAEFFRNCLKAPFEQHRKRQIQEAEEQESRRMRKRAQPAMEPRWLPGTEAPARGDAKSRAQKREERLHELLPRARGLLGDAEYHTFKELIESMPKISRSRAAGADSASDADARECFRELRKLFSGSSDTVDVLRDFVEFVPRNLQSEYRRQVLGFVIGGRSHGEPTRSEILMKKTREAVGEEVYAAFRRKLSQLKSESDKANPASLRALLSELAGLLTSNVSNGRSPSAAELLLEWKRLIPQKCRAILDEIVANTAGGP